MTLRLWILIFYIIIDDNKSQPKINLFCNDMYKCHKHHNETMTGCGTESQWPVSILHIFSGWSNMYSRFNSSMFHTLFSFYSELHISFLFTVWITEMSCDFFFRLILFLRYWKVWSIIEIIIKIKINFN